MKKFLSLVLALTMAVSLVTFSTSGAGAATSFTDAASITYKEAVDVISSLKIMEGYSDGSFRPGNNLTRGAASKVICSLVLGPENASKLSTDASSFPDVGRGTTFAGYIAWCVQQKIISGYADGTFRPSNALTGNAFMKMLLGILGYDQVKEGYSGTTNWSFNVQTQAQSSGLMNGLVGAFEGKDPVSRQNACLFSFNTLQADLVSYPNNAAKPSVVTWEAENDIAKNISADKATNGKVKIQFAEQYFSKLVKQDASDSFGRPANRWRLNGSNVGTYPAAAAATYYDDVTSGDLYNALNLTENVQNTATDESGNKLENALSIYVNGVSVTDWDKAAIKRNDKTKLSAMVNAANQSDIGPGVEIQAFRSDGKVSVCVTPYYAGKVSNVTAGTNTRKRSITITPAATNKPTTDASYTFETASFAKDDVIAYTYSAKDNAVQDVVELNLQSGKLTGKAVGSSLAVANESYNYAQKIHFTGGITDSAMKIGENYSVYTLSLGGDELALWVESGSTDVDGYALVTVADSNSVDGNRARLLITDCGMITEITVTLDNKSDTVAKDDIVRFTANSDGTYNLKKIGADELATATGSSISNRSIANLTQGGNAVLLDDDTVFVIRDKNGYQYYEGNRTIPNVTSGEAFAYVTGTGTKTAKIVFFFSSDTTTTTRTDTMFVAANSASTVKSDGTYSGYRTFNAVIGTKITTIDVKVGGELNGGRLNAHKLDENGNAAADAGDDVVLEVLDSDKNADQKNESCVIVNSAEVYDNGIYSSALFVGNRGVSTFKDVGISAPAGGNLTFGGRSDLRFAMSSSLRAYTVSKDGKIEAASRSDITADSSAVVYYTLDNSNEITNLFIVKTTDN